MKDLQQKILQLIQEEEGENAEITNVRIKYDMTKVESSEITIGEDQPDKKKKRGPKPGKRRGRKPGSKNKPKTRFKDRYEVVPGDGADPF